MQTMTIRARRTRKALFVLPLLITPFLCLAFWAVGGGKSKSTVSPSSLKGFNLHLPDPFFSENKELDKWAYYSKEEALAKKEAAAERKERYWRGEGEMEEEENPTSIRTSSKKQISAKQVAKGKSVRTLESSDQQSEALLEKLEQLEQSLAASSNEPALPESVPPSVPAQSEEITDLSAMMMELQKDNISPDTEMDRLDSMLDKILKIQQGNWSGEEDGPVVTEKIKIPANEILSDVSIHPAGNQVGDFVNESTYFFSGEESVDYGTNPPLRAMVYGDQVLVPGASVHLLLLDSVQASGHRIPAFSSLHGTTSLQGDRLQILGKTMLGQGELIPISWQVMDMDGLVGISVPSSLTRESLRQSAGQAVQGIDMMGSFNPSLSVQAATAGIQAAKTMLTKRTRQVKLNLPAGYRVWIQVN